VTQPHETNDARRLELVAAAGRQWTDALTDLGGRNTLLYYKDRRAGTLDLAAADPDALERFEKTGHTKLTRLFLADADQRADAIRRMQTIYRKARELQEERGIRAGYLATGLARWDELFLEPAAPVLLRALTIAPTRARYDDFDLTLDDDVEVNPVLLHKLASVFGAVIEKPSPERIAAQLARAAAHAEIPGFAIEKRKVIGTFTYAKLPMVRDLEAAGDLLADSDLVAAIAGDATAQQAVAADPGQPATVTADPANDYSILDADSSQRSAIDAVLEGRSLVIHGPPGTGKSQTIANLIAAVVARGRKVLFVAEKRAAIDAVLSRLVGVNLGDLVLDIHEGTRDRQRIAADLGATLDLAEHATTPDTAALHRRLTDRQQRLTRHANALHRVHEPWLLTAYQVQSALLGVPPAARVSARLAAPEDITPALADDIRDELREFTRLGGFTLRLGSTPWFGAALRTRAQAHEAVELAAALSARTLPQAGAMLAAACRETGLPPASSFSYPERTRLTHLFQLLHEAGQPSRGFRERRALRRQAKAEWAALAGPGSAAGGALPAEPRLPSGYPALARAWQECSRQVSALAALAPLAGVEDDPEAAAAALAADRETPWRLPRLHELARRFESLGLAPLLDEVALAEDVTPDLVADAFDYAWYQSVLDQIRVRDPGYGAEYGAALDEIAEEFRRRDTEHLTANRARVRSVWARQLRETVDRHPLQARVIRKQAALRRGHLPLRRLLDQTSDVLFALKPCWAMSPLMVSQVLPLARMFDLVIFDEASQIVPADAIGSMIRAHQVVVAGDDRQLPPTNFFRQVDSGDPDDEDADPETVSFGAGFESVLDALRPLLPTCPLNWHYRSRDERLVAFSNDRIYGGALTTFPGVARDDCLRHVVTGDGDAEVAEVVRLILEHARTRPSESLGVIALGMRHAERVDAALRAALAGAPDLEAFFAEDVPEPFFVKNLERVQGDERDAIILSVGYGKHPDGRMRYQWGPLLRDGGERRLNVAATRAKRRLTVVSSFSSHDVDPARLVKPGARLLAEYLEYAGSGGTPVVASGSTAGLGAFEADVIARLAALGITVVPQYGVGGYRVDFAAAHPDDPSQMILAVEADGASYRGSGSVRDRDRLRKEHLERLGWRVHRLWSTSWFTNPDAELAKLRAAYREAVAATPPPPPPPPAPDIPSSAHVPAAPSSAPEAPPPAPADPAADEPLQHHELPSPLLPQAPPRPPALGRPNAAALPRGSSAQDSGSLSMP
jgi:very-short-patch-repair endonuclease